MTPTPRISVALPTCNGARHLREALASILAQTGAEFDLVVSDDRSDDDTLAIVREVCGDRAQVSLNSERLGLAGNWNRCVELSQTDWVAIFHQDDLMKPGHLESQLRLSESDPQVPVGILAGPVVMIDDDGRPIPAEVVDPGGLNVLSGSPFRSDAQYCLFTPGSWRTLLAVQNPLRCSAVTIRRTAHQAVGGFDPSYRYVVDWDFWLRVAESWWLAWAVGPATVAMRWHASSETQRFLKGTTDLEETTRLLDSMDGKAHSSRRSRRQADRILARAYLNRAYVALKGGDESLARHCLFRSFQLAPTILATIAEDPRLAVQMAALAVAPGFASRRFRRSSGE